MSQENVDVVRRAWEAWSRGDVDTVFEVFDPAVVWDLTRFEGWPEDAFYHGHAGLRRFFEEWLADWERYEAGADQYLDVDDDQVLVLCWQRGIGTGSHAPVEMAFAQIVTVKHGLICRADNYSDRREALEAAGLSE
jgi:ketosteroid isomerase-like protein